MKKNIYIIIFSPCVYLHTYCVTHPVYIYSVLNITTFRLFSSPVPIRFSYLYPRVLSEGNNYRLVDVTLLRRVAQRTGSRRTATSHSTKTITPRTRRWRTIKGDWPNLRQEFNFLFPFRGRSHTGTRPLPRPHSPTFPFDSQFSWRSFLPSRVGTKSSKFRFYPWSRQPLSLRFTGGPPDVSYEISIDSPLPSVALCLFPVQFSVLSMLRDAWIIRRCLKIGWDQSIVDREKPLLCGSLLGSFRVQETRLSIIIPCSIEIFRRSVRSTRI